MNEEWRCPKLVKVSETLLFLKDEKLIFKRIVNSKSLFKFLT